MPLTGVPLTASTTRSASSAGTERMAKRSSTRTSRTASPSRPVALGHGVDEVGDLDARRRCRRPAISLAYGSSPLRETCGLEWRRGRSLDRGRLDVRARRPGRDAGADVALDRLELALLARLDEGDGAARAADAAGAPDAVHVDVGRDRHVVVDDVGDRRDVEAASGDVGGHEDRQAAALEGEHHAVARALGHVAVQRLDVHAVVAQRAVELVAADLRAHEDDRLVGLLGLQHLDELVGLLGGLTSTANCSTVSTVSVAASTLTCSGS